MGKGLQIQGCQSHVTLYVRRKRRITIHARPVRARRGTGEEHVRLTSMQAKRVSALLGALAVGVMCCLAGGLGTAAVATPALGDPAGSVSGGKRLVVFPIDLSQPRTEEDFYRGVQGPSPEEAQRLTVARDELSRRVQEKGGFEIVDIAPIAEKVKAAQPIFECNGCELDLAKDLKADLMVTAVIDKISETHLSLNVAMVDVAASRIVESGSVLIQGNTDEAWLHGVKWLVKNRLLVKKDETAR